MTSAAPIASLCLDPAVSSTAPNKPSIVPSGIRRKAGFAAVPARFKITEFVNPRTHSVSYRVTGSRRSGERVRENFSDPAKAQLRQMALEAEFLGSHRPAQLQHTALTPDQLRLAEAAVLKLGADWLQLPDAVTFWQQRDKPLLAATVPNLDDAVNQFLLWVDDAPLRPHSKPDLKNRVRAFKAGMENRAVNTFRAADIELFLARYGTSAVNRDNVRRAVSRFFSWAKERPRHWVTTNPCADVRVARPERDRPPDILTVDQCEALLRAAEKFKDGKLVPYVALGLFGLFRPFETVRLERRQLNLDDGEVRCEKWQSKTRGRLVVMNKTLRAWLKAYPGVAGPKNWRKDFAEVRKLAGLTKWPVDVLRHTAISHHFRAHKSYGLTAEQAGNSEGVIKAHYQGRVTAKETKRFYELRPSKKLPRG